MLKPKQLFIIIYVNVCVERVYPHKTKNHIYPVYQVKLYSRTNTSSYSIWMYNFHVIYNNN